MKTYTRSSGTSRSGQGEQQADAPSAINSMRRVSCWHQINQQSHCAWRYSADEGRPSMCNMPLPLPRHHGTNLSGI
jgi:hypothetical protein